MNPFKGKLPKGYRATPIHMDGLQSVWQVWNQRGEWITTLDPNLPPLVSVESHLKYIRWRAKQDASKQARTTETSIVNEPKG